MHSPSIFWIVNLAVFTFGSIFFILLHVTILRDLGEREIPRKFKIMLFLGAGASAPFGYPTTEQFLRNLAENLSGPEADLLADLVKVKGVSDIEHILLMLDALPLVNENLLKVFQAFSSSISIAKRSLKMVAFIELGLSLREKVRDAIFKEYELNPKVRKEAQEAYEKLFAILQKYQEPKQGSIVSTSNYDRVIEDFCANSDYKLIDGFSHEPRARVYKWAPKQFEEVADENTIKLFKLHGSLNWLRKVNGDIIEVYPEQRTMGGRRYKENILIYPASKEKPDIEPFITLYDNFERHVLETNVLLSIGFSYRDEYLNDILRRSLGSKKGAYAICVGGDFPPHRRARSLHKFGPKFPEDHIFNSIRRLLSKWHARASRKK